MMNKYEFLGDEVKIVNNPNMHYSYVYAPNATDITVGSVDTVFCGHNTKIHTPCNDVRRGEFYLEHGFIRNRSDKNFKYALHFNDCGYDEVQFQPVSMDKLQCSLDIMETVKNIEVCKQKIKEQNAGLDTENDSQVVIKIKKIFGDAKEYIRQISIKEHQLKK